MSESIEIVLCPHCGCGRTFIEDVRDSFGMTSERRRCGYCAKVFSHTPTIVFQGVRCRCPICKAENPQVTRTMPKSADGTTQRHHKCDRCSHTFKSVEKR